MANRPRGEPEPERTAGAATQRTMLFPRRELTAHDAREFVAAALTQWGHRERLDDIRLCTSELVTNALLHGTSTDDAILVRIELHNAQVLVEVHDGGEGTPRQRQVQNGSDDGRGLFLVSAVADGWGVAAREGPGKRVWAFFKVPVMSTC
ncbi:ATP-binding protein [Streptomyces sp. NPDC059037]|uniref:ATP-binding protein n=1 Tax=Streptomyces sp. NPDC059037 TaxID=3346710 RepID=UPI0036B9AA6D